MAAYADIKATLDTFFSACEDMGDVLSGFDQLIADVGV